ncbi:MAG TPA: nucleotidyltransferase family protein [Planctomycetaceae bacterium]|nr:nucleotidyltransferase family protein [Planctomycetaceae bacterium]
MGAILSEAVGAILAGGLGTRLRAAVSDRPKVLAVVRGRPFLAYLLDQLASAGIKRVVLMTGHRGEQIKDQFGDSYGPIELDYSAESAPLGTAGALRFAYPTLFGPVAASGPETARTVLVMNGDSYCALDLAKFVATGNRAWGHAGLVLTRVADTARFGHVEIGIDGRVVRFIEKADAAGAGWINAGIYLVDRELVAEIPEGRAVSIEREMFPAWCRRQRLSGFRTDGDFIDIGTPESYLAAEEFFSRSAAA